MAEPTQTEQIAAKLGLELKKKKIDFSEVSRLATELSGLDSTSAAFSVSSTIVRRLGEELVAKQETALGELVKNAYDADSSVVTVTFSAQHKKGGRLIINDNGTGMTPEALRSGFLHISSDDKLRNPISDRYDRRRAGQKGIGRFAVERLGRKLIVTTQTLLDPLATELSIDWTAFERSENLVSIRSPIRRIPKTCPEGTQLIIDDLRETWTNDQIQQVYSYVNDLMEAPLYSSKDAPKNVVKPHDKSLNRDPGFHVDFKVLTGALPQTIVTPLPELLDHAVGSVEGEVNDDKEWSFRFKSKKLKLDEEINENTVDKKEFTCATLKTLRGLRFKAYYFVFDEEIVTGIGIKKVQSDVRMRYGVRLYRNGFRVPPYGNAGNDWLGFDESEGKRQLLPPHGNKNWIGYVAVDDPANQYLNETSSREGVIENEFFRELQNFISQSLLSIVIRTGRLRNKKVFPHDKGFGEQRANRVQAATKRASLLVKDLKKLRSSSNNSYTKEELTNSGLEELAVELEAVIKDSSALTSEISMLRVLASMGLSITLFSHEVRSLLSSALINLEKQISQNDLPKAHLAKLKDLSRVLTQLRIFTSYYDRTAAASINRNIDGIDLLPHLEDFTQRFREHASVRGVRLEIDASSDLPLKMVKIHEAEIAAILLNLFTNAMKAIAKVQPKKPGLISIKLTYNQQSAIIDFQDNGCGIDASIKDKMFEPFVTTSSTVHQSRPGDPDSLGTGLGLSIVRDSVISSGGKVEAVAPTRGFATCFRVQLPFQQNEE